MVNEYSNTTIRDSSGNIIGYRPVTPSSPYVPGGIQGRPTGSANYLSLINQYNQQHYAIVGSSGTYYPNPETGQYYNATTGINFQNYDPSGNIGISGRAGFNASTYQPPKQSIYWQPESQLQKNYYADTLQKYGVQPSVYQPLLNNVFGADYVNPYRSQFENYQQRAYDAATISTMPSSFYMREGYSNRELLDSKVVVDPLGGSFGVYQQRPARPGFTPYYGFQTAGGSQGAAQSGGFGFAPTSPWITNQWNDTLSPRADPVLSALIKADPFSFSRPGAEAYGGYVMPLDNRTLQPGTEMGRYPNQPWNLANFVNPFGANLPKNQMANLQIPWQIGFTNAPTLQGVTKEGVFSGIAMPTTPSQQRASLELPSQNMWSEATAKMPFISVLAGRQPATTATNISMPSAPGSFTAGGFSFTPIGTQLSGAGTQPVIQPSQMSQTILSESWLQGLGNPAVGGAIAGLPVGGVVDFFQGIGAGFNMLTGQPFSRPSSGSMTLGDYQTQYFPTSQVQNIPILGNIAKNSAMPMTIDYTLQTGASGLSQMAGGKEDFQWKMAPSMKGYESAPWLPSKGTSYSGGSPELATLGNQLYNAKSSLESRYSALESFGSGKIQNGMWTGSALDYDIYRSGAEALSTDTSRYNADIDKYNNLSAANPIYATNYDVSKTSAFVGNVRSTGMSDFAAMSRTVGQTILPAAPTVGENTNTLLRFGSGFYSEARDNPFGLIFATGAAAAGGWALKSAIGVGVAGTSLAAGSTAFPLAARGAQFLSSPGMGMAFKGLELGVGGLFIGSAIQDIATLPTPEQRGAKTLETMATFAGFGLGYSKGWSPDITTPGSRFYNPYVGKGWDPVTWARGKIAGTDVGSPITPGSGGSGGSGFGGSIETGFASRMTGRQIALTEKFTTGEITSRMYNKAMGFPEIGSDIAMSYEGGYRHPVGSGFGEPSIGSYSVLPERFGMGQKSILPTYRGTTPTGYGGIRESPFNMPSGKFDVGAMFDAPKPIATARPSTDTGTFSILPMRKGVSTGTLALPDIGGTSFGRDTTFDLVGRETYNQGQYLQELRTRDEVQYGNVKAQQWYEAGEALQTYKPGASTKLAGASLELFSPNFRNTLLELQQKPSVGIERSWDIDMGSGEILAQHIGGINEMQTTPAGKFAVNYAGRKVAVVHEHVEGLSPELGRFVTSDIPFGQTDKGYIHSINEMGGEVGASVLLTKNKIFVERPYQLSDRLASMSEQDFSNELNLVAAKNAHLTGDTFQIMAFKDANVNAAGKQGTLFYEIGRQQKMPGGQQTLGIYGVNLPAIGSPLKPVTRVKIGKAGTSSKKGLNASLEEFNNQFRDNFPRDANRLHKDTIKRKVPTGLIELPSKPAITLVGGKYTGMRGLSPQRFQTGEGNLLEIFEPVSKAKQGENIKIYEMFDKRGVDEIINTDWTSGGKRGENVSWSAKRFARNAQDVYFTHPHMETLVKLRAGDNTLKSVMAYSPAFSSIDYLATTEEGKGYGKLLVGVAETDLQGKGMQFVEVQVAENAIPFYEGQGYKRAKRGDNIYVKYLQQDTLHKDVIQPYKKYDVDTIRSAGKGVTILGDEGVRYTESPIHPIKMYAFKETGHTLQQVQGIPMERYYYETGAADRQSTLVNQLRNEIGLTQMNNRGASEMMHAAVDTFEISPSNRENVSRIFILRDSNKSLGALGHANIYDKELSINYVGARRGNLKQSLGFGGEMAFSMLGFGTEAKAKVAILTPKDAGAAKFWGKWGFEYSDSGVMERPLTKSGMKAQENRKAAYEAKRPAAIQAVPGFEKILDLDTGEMRWRKLQQPDYAVLRKDVIAPPVDTTRMNTLTELIKTDKLDVFGSAGEFNRAAQFRQVANEWTFSRNAEVAKYGGSPWKQQFPFEVLTKENKKIYPKPEAKKQTLLLRKDVIGKPNKMPYRTELDIVKSERSKQTYKPATTEKQQAAFASEQFIARLVGGETTPKLHPVDILNVGDWAVEVKTVFPGAHEKMTMHGYERKSGYNALEAKRLFVEGKNQIWSLPAGVTSLRGASLMRVMATNKIYVKEGFGSYRSSAMTEVNPRQVAGLRKVDALNELLRKDIITDELKRPPRNLFEERTGLQSFGKNKPAKVISQISEGYTGSRLSQEELVGQMPFREMDIAATRQEIAEIKPKKVIDMVVESEQPSAILSPAASERFIKPVKKGSWNPQNLGYEGRVTAMKKARAAHFQRGSVSGKNLTTVTGKMQEPVSEMSGMVRIRDGGEQLYGMQEPMLIRPPEPPKIKLLGGHGKTESAVKVFEAKEAAKAGKQFEYYWGQGGKGVKGKWQFERAIEKQKEWEAERTGLVGLDKTPIGRAGKGKGGNPLTKGLTGGVGSPVKQGRGNPNAELLSLGSGGRSTFPQIEAPATMSDILGMSASARRRVRAMGEEPLFEHTQLPPGMARPTPPGQRNKPQTYLSYREDSRLSEEQRGAQIAMQNARNKQSLFSVPRTEFTSDMKEEQSVAQASNLAAMTAGIVASVSLLKQKQAQWQQQDQTQKQMQDQILGQQLVVSQSQMQVQIPLSLQLTGQEVKSMQIQDQMQLQSQVQLQKQQQLQVSEILPIGFPLLRTPIPQVPLRPIRTPEIPYKIPPFEFPRLPPPPTIPRFGLPFWNSGSDSGVPGRGSAKRAHRESIFVLDELAGFALGNRGGHKKRRR